MLGADVLRAHTVVVQREGLVSVFRAGGGSAGRGIQVGGSSFPPPCSPGGLEAGEHVLLPPSAMAPRLLCVTPAAAAGAGGTVELYAAGLGLVQPGARVLLRTQGGYLPVTCEPAAKGDPRAGKMLAQAAAVCPDAAASVDVIRVTARSVPGPGLALLEVQAPGGLILSNWLPVVLTSSEEEASELAGLEAAVSTLCGTPDGLASVDSAVPAVVTTASALLGYGRLLDYMHSVRHYPLGGGGSACSSSEEACVTTLLDTARLRCFFLAAGLHGVARAVAAANGELHAERSGHQAEVLHEDPEEEEEEEEEAAGTPLPVAAGCHGPEVVAEVEAVDLESGSVSSPFLISWRPAASCAATSRDYDASWDRRAPVTSFA